MPGEKVSFLAMGSQETLSSGVRMVQRMMVKRS